MCQSYRLKSSLFKTLIYLTKITSIQLMGLKVETGSRVRVLESENFQEVLADKAEAAVLIAKEMKMS